MERIKLLKLANGNIILNGDKSISSDYKVQKFENHSIVIYSKYNKLENFCFLWEQFYDSTGLIPLGTDQQSVFDNLVQNFFFCK